MDILLTAATGAEIAPLIKQIGGHSDAEKGPFQVGVHNIYIGITGVGMVSTAYKLAKLLAVRSYDLVVQAGIGGSFDRNIELGSVVAVGSDRFADIGAMDGEEFIDIFDLGLLQVDEYPFVSKLLNNPLDINSLSIDLPVVDALTVNTVTGNEERVKELASRHKCTLESMEGAAFHYVCMLEEQSFLQVRAISNYVERRNRAGWQIGKAIGALNDAIADVFATLPAKMPAF